MDDIVLSLKQQIPSIILAIIFAGIWAIIYGIHRFIQSFTPALTEEELRMRQEQEELEEIRIAREDNKQWKLAIEEIEAVNLLIEKWGGEKLE